MWDQFSSETYFCFKSTLLTKNYIMFWLVWFLCLMAYQPYNDLRVAMKSNRKKVKEIVAKNIDNA